MLKQTLALVGLTLSLSANAASTITYDMGGVISSTPEHVSSVELGDSWSINVTAEVRQKDLNPNSERGRYQVQWFGVINIGGFSYAVSDTTSNASSNLVIPAIKGGGHQLDLNVNTTHPFMIDGRDINLVRTLFWDSKLTALQDDSMEGTADLTLENFDNGVVYFEWSGCCSDMRGDVTYFQSTLNAVPVPAAAWLFGSALVGLAGSM